MFKHHPNLITVSEIVGIMLSGIVSESLTRGYYADIVEIVHEMAMI